MTEPTVESYDGSEGPVTETGEAAPRSVSRLVGHLVDDARTLIRQELELAKLELRQSVSALARNSALLGIGIAIIALGFLLLLVFLVVGLGALLGGEYWLSSLIIGGGLVLFGGILLLSGRSGLRSGLTPKHSRDTLRQDKEWVETEFERIKRDLRN